MADITNGLGLYREEVLVLARALVANVEKAPSKDAALRIRIAERLRLAVANYSDSHEVLRLDLREVKI